MRATRLRSCGIGDIVTVDIGGTSADICLLRGGQIRLTQHGRIGEWPLPLPMVDMVTIGAGGGSIARLSDGALTVGPASAGAMPGPACYGAGGEQPTVTDAHLVLGHLPASLLGGRMALDASLAAQAIQAHVAEPLGLSLHEAARGILAIANSNMVGAIRVVSVERGHDPRDFTLVPFGGAGPLHGCALADLLGITQVLVPPAPGVLCAEGLLAAALKSEFSRTLPRPDEWDAADAMFAALEEEAQAWFEAERVTPEDRKTTRVALLRYQGQGAELAIAWPGGVEAARYSVRCRTPGIERFHAGCRGGTGDAARGSRGKRAAAVAAGSAARRGRRTGRAAGRPRRGRLDGGVGL